MNSKNKPVLQTFLIAILFLIAITLWTVWQFHFNYMISLYDTFFHSERIYEIRLAFLQHSLPSWVNFNSFFNTGQAINGMYPDFTLWPFVWITDFLTPIHQIIAIRSLIAVSTFVVTFLSLNKRFDSRNAILAATIFSLSGSVLKDLANEMQTGTAIVMIFAFPIIFTLKDIIESDKIEPPLIIKTALLMTIVINSHLLSAVAITMIAGIFLIIETFIKKSFIPWINLIIAALLTIVLCAPIIYRIIKISKTGLLSPFGLGHVASDPIWTIFTTARWNSKSTISIASIILLVIVGIGFKKEKLRQMLPWILIELVLLLFCTNIVPWNLLDHLPIINSFQVANWRFAPFLGMIPLILILINFSKKKALVILGLMAALSYLLALKTTYDQQHTNQSMPLVTQYSTKTVNPNGLAKVTSTGINSDTIIRTLIPDYSPNSVPIEKGSNGLNLDSQIVYLLSKHIGQTNNRDIPLKQTSPDVNTLELSADNIPKGQFTLPLYNYNSLNYQVTLNGQKVKASRNKVGFMVVNSSKDMVHATYQIKQVQPKLYRVLIFVSFTLFFVLLIIVIIPTIKKVRQLY